MMPLVQKRFWFLVHEKACSTKKSFWSSDPHQAIFLNIFYRHPIWHSHLIPHIFWHPIWIWHSIWYIYPWRFFVVEVRRGTLWYRGCCWGPAGNTLIRSLRWRSRGKHSGPELGGGGPAGNTLIQRLLLGSGGEHSDPELAVRVRRGKLRSRDCSWGPAGITLILSLLFGSGGENCDLELAVEVRRGSLWSRGCCSGPEGNIAI